ncbi:MAG: hypothetical protein A3H36_00180 [Chloroflexi bacterium RIFCSPLOWO2_02_FULL_71_16]|nr:MAG: hypothetical protein A3H36_00180 [Chloroflexi bacterium RIFCSPLOWO2_02_FULL_71_16]
MNTTLTHDHAAEARERLVHRARREGLATVGYGVLDSPVGPLWVAVGPRGVAAVTFDREPNERDLRRIVAAYGPGVVPDPRRIGPVARELERYFSGRLRAFETPVDLSGITAFQRRVLTALAKIRYGELTTYLALARRGPRRRVAVAPRRCAQRVKDERLAQGVRPLRDEARRAARARARAGSCTRCP